MLDTLISSKTRVKLLMRLFLNPGNSAHLRGLADDFGESTNAVRLELNRFEEAGMLISELKGNKKIYQANSQHPFYGNIQSILMKYIGIDRVIDNIINRLGNLEKMYLTGDYALGRGSDVIDLVFVGNIDRQYLFNLTERAEKLVGKRIRYIVYDQKEWLTHIGNGQYENLKILLLWERR